MRLAGAAVVGFVAVAVTGQAQTSNKPHRVFNYSSRIQLLDTPTALLKPVSQPDEPKEEPPPAAAPAGANLTTPALRSLPPRRVNLKRDQDRDKLQWIIPPSGETNGPPASVSGWGWLVDEVEAMRRYSDPIFSDKDAEDNAFIKPSSAGGSNSLGRTRLGLISDQAYQPTLPLDSNSNRVEQVISDRSLAELQRRKTDAPIQPLDLTRRADRLLEAPATNDAVSLIIPGTGRLTPDNPPALPGKSVLSDLIKPYLTEMSGGATFKPAAAEPAAVPPRLAAEPPPTDLPRRWPTAGNPADPAPAGAAQRSPAAPITPGGMAPHSIQPVTFTPTTLYTSPLNILPPAGSKH